MNENVTILLQQIDQGEASLEADLLPLIYEELKRIAQNRLKNEAPGHTLQATALVNEYYLKLSNLETAGLTWENRRHFFQAAAKAMQRILVDHARQKKSQKRGSGQPKAELREDQAANPQQEVDLIALNDALESLEAASPRAAEVVRLKYFAGMTISEIAKQLEMSDATVEREWGYAKLRLQAELQ